ncbi:MAG: helix-turn-helix transcriptional regulator [Acidobacteria bacterium]|nr:helix-turn-helix transcriptional regulator [Acidobacteriota bacterium]
MDEQALFGSRIRSLREAADVSRERAAENADINANYLGEIERGEKWPSIDVIQRLARALKVSPSAFFDFEGEENDAIALRSKLHELLASREIEQLQQAMRVLRALFQL